VRIYYSRFESPIGALTLVGDAAALQGVYLDAATRNAESALRADPAPLRDDAHFREARRQLEEYFAGERREFELDLAPAGTPFQQRVWQATAAIPYGATASYRTVAERLQMPRAVRAVGAANGRNPLLIVIPCHRVIGSSGSLTGYGGGLERKRWLLDHEGRGACERARCAGAVSAAP